MDSIGSFDEESSSSSTRPLLQTVEKFDLERSRRNFVRSLLPWILHGAALTMLLFSSAYVLVSNKTSNLVCVERQSTWSPALAAVEPLTAVKFNGTLDHPSPFRGKGPSVDVAWETLVRRKTVGAFGLSDSDFQKLGQPAIPELTRVSERQGGQIYATLEVFHQLHCVNFIRQYTFREYYEPQGAFHDPPDLTRIHVDHCLEMLRQKITCDGDVGVITQNWVKRRETPWPNFNTWHTCRNFDGIVEWSREHNVPYYGEKLTRPSDIAGLDPPP